MTPLPSLDRASEGGAGTGGNTSKFASYRAALPPTQSYASVTHHFSQPSTASSANNSNMGAAQRHDGSSYSSYASSSSSSSYQQQQPYQRRSYGESPAANTTTAGSTGSSYQAPGLSPPSTSSYSSYGAPSPSYRPYAAGTQQQQQQHSHYQQAHHSHPHHHHHHQSHSHDAYAHPNAAPSTSAPTPSSMSMAQAIESSSAAHHGNASGSGSAEADTPSQSGTSGAATYSATGRKRKRLQKACVSCHKAKRRCDGGLPCSNCDFSGRTCHYSDASGNVVPPTPATVRPGAKSTGTVGDAPEGSSPRAPAPTNGNGGRDRTKTTESGRSDTSSPRMPHMHNAGAIAPAAAAPVFAVPSNGAPSYAPAHGYPSGSSPRFSVGSASTPAAAAAQPQRVDFGRPSLGGSAEVEISKERSMELISSFFNHAFPFNQIVDEITFHRELGKGNISDLLLYAIYAIGARFHAGASGRAGHYHHHQYHHQQHPDAIYGESDAYARRARSLLAQEQAGAFHDDSAEEEEADLDPLPSHNATTSLDINGVYASSLLAACDLLAGRHTRAALQTASSWRMVTLLGLDRGQYRSARPCPAPYTSARNQASLRRLAMLAYLLDVLVAVLTGAAPSAPAQTTQRFAEAGFGGSGSGADEVTTALFHAVASVDVFRTVLDATRDEAAAAFAASGSKTASLLLPPASPSIDAGHRALASWAQSLPATLQFNEEVLRAATRDFLDASAHGRAVAPVHASWACMHLFAELSNLLLNHRRGPIAIASQNAARSNVGHVLEAMGAAGRATHLLAFPAALAAAWTAAGASSSGYGMQAAGAEKLQLWWADCRTMFRLSETKVQHIAASLGIAGSSSSGTNGNNGLSSRPSLSHLPSYDFLGRSNDGASAFPSIAPSLSTSLSTPTARASYSNGNPTLRSVSIGATGTALQLPPLPALRLSSASSAASSTPANHRSNSFESLRLSPISPPMPSTSVAATVGTNNNAAARNGSASPPTPALSLTRGSRTESISSQDSHCGGGGESLQPLRFDRGIEQSSERDEPMAASKRPRYSHEQHHLIERPLVGAV